LEVFFEERFELSVTNDILMEYEEVVGRKFNQELAREFIGNLYRSLSLIKISPPYRHRLIPADPDDNKFVDCYLWANADYLVTNDKHFAPLKSLDYPKINVIDIDGFVELLEKEK
jgi:putative PIN family toxin of toxin-antitoxin system